MGKWEIDMYEEMKIKADILTDALPYIQDFNGNIMVIQYSCNHYVDEAQERVILKDIALLKFLGMKPIIVHSARKGVDLFRENKRIASLIEENQIKAIGICGIDIQTLTMMVANDYIPVVIPNDIATEGQDFFVENVAREIAVKMKADKLIFISKDKGIQDQTGHIISMMSLKQLKDKYQDGHFDGFLDLKIQNAITAIEQGVRRVHIIDGLLEHSILLELFSVQGIGTAILDREDHLYKHEKDILI